jgi:UDPglucose 6-dehydrogenase/UDP-N-acetyl-D-galactosamine dehydrogenase
VDYIIVSSPHEAFAGLTLEKVLSICNGKPIIVDVTEMLRRNDGMRQGCVYRTL